MPYTPTIGLEVHAELKTKSKMFCSCANDPAGRAPNTNVCPVCLGHPGTLPVPNKEAVYAVIKVGLAAGCEIAKDSKFDRKNYFYPDLPKGYQISQYDKPLCQGGELAGVKLTRIHLEEDTGRLVHPKGESFSLVDFNRAGVPLLELVTEPVITSAAEARRFAEELQLLLRYLEVSDANMEQGQMRVEANVSVSKGKSKGVKVEVKNLNSFRSVERAIVYETERQTKLLEREKEVVQETRGWDEAKQETFSQREKEEAHDYRYFPEPDIPMMHFKADEIRRIKRQLPELPAERRARLASEYGLAPQTGEVLVRDKELGEFFERAVSELKTLKEYEPRALKLAANYAVSDLRGFMRQTPREEPLITPENFAELVLMLVRGEVSSAAAKTVLAEMYGTGVDPSRIVKEKGLAQVSDEGQLASLVDEVIADNPDAVKDAKEGKTGVLRFLVGQVMAASKGQANPQTAQKLLADKLGVTP